ncbi:Hypothetical predicted protein, partial [Olea europaea subsp. europaea]
GATVTSAQERHYCTVAKKSGRGCKGRDGDLCVGASLLREDESEEDVAGDMSSSDFCEPQLRAAPETALATMPSGTDWVKEVFCDESSVNGVASRWVQT